MSGLRHTLFHGRGGLSWSGTHEKYTDQARARSSMSDYLDGGTKKASDCVMCSRLRSGRVRDAVNVVAEIVTEGGKAVAV